MAPPHRRISWLEDVGRRHALVATAKKVYPDLTFDRIQHKTGAVYVARMVMPVPDYEPRKVRVEFRPKYPWRPTVTVDGPEDSLHRYSQHELCLWYPTDPVELRWVPEDGLLALLGLIQAHLFKEAYWREHREWLGDEAPHEVAGKSNR